MLAHSPVAAAGALAALAVVALAVVVPVAQWLSGRIAARVRGARAPSGPGPAGILGPLARGAGWLQSPQPAGTGDPPLHRAGPLLALVPPALLFGLCLGSAAAVVWPRAASGLDPAAGLLWLLAGAALVGHVSALAGPGSGTRRAAAGAARAAAIQSGALLALALCLVALAAACGSDRLGQISLAQARPLGPVPRWNLWLQPLGLLCYLAAALALAPARPFAAAGALELGGHPQAGYGGIGLVLWEAGRLAFLGAAAALGAQLYLGGPHLPVPAPWRPAAAAVGLGAKALVLLVILLWAEAALPRLPAREAVRLWWQVLVPLAAVNLAIAAGLAAARL